MKTNGWFARRQIAGIIARCIRETRWRLFKVARLMETRATGPFVRLEIYLREINRPSVHCASVARIEYAFIDLRAGLY